MGKLQSSKQKTAEIFNWLGYSAESSLFDNGKLPLGGSELGKFRASE